MEDKKLLVEDYVKNITDESCKNFLQNLFVTNVKSEFKNEITRIIYILINPYCLTFLHLGHLRDKLPKQSVNLLIVLSAPMSYLHGHLPKHWKSGIWKHFYLIVPVWHRI